ncbi:hypothetical protein BJ508DRAFT_307630 [Ascobolus immersus RN42]|uniref:Uncharacterized protein n=1 Tax=Ascobolus immersus RN42 TaxID=1160509 RepID=A0A3N4I4D0_ASCIM|nr:hypothetical protein BJ508DRAFT_307630 [Ascobolus immersus RN42]
MVVCVEVSKLPNSRCTWSVLLLLTQGPEAPVTEALALLITCIQNPITKPPLDPNPTMSSPPTSSAPTGHPHPLPPTYQAHLTKCAEPTSLDLGIHLGPSKVPPQIHPFLALCEQHSIIPYDEVLYDNNLQAFINRRTSSSCCTSFPTIRTASIPRRMC